MFVTFALLWKLIRYLLSIADTITDTMTDANDVNECSANSGPDTSDKCDDTTDLLLFRDRIDSELLNSNYPLCNRSTKFPTTRHSSGALTPSPPNPPNTHSVHRSSYPSGLRVSTYHPLRIGPRLFRDKSSLRYISHMY